MARAQPAEGPEGASTWMARMRGEVLLLQVEAEPDGRMSSTCERREHVDVVTYTSEQLKGAMQLLGLKPRHANRAATRVFDALRKAYAHTRESAEAPAEAPTREVHLDIDEGAAYDETEKHARPEPLPNDCPVCRLAMRFFADGQIGARADAVGRGPLSAGDGASFTSLPATVLCLTIPRTAFEGIVLLSIAEYKYFRGGAVAAASDLRIATDIIERRTSYAVLLCGTSGTGKSTLASLLAGRLGITTVISTDSIRQMLRSTIADAGAGASAGLVDQSRLLCASTYNAGDVLHREECLARSTTTSAGGDARTSPAASHAADLGVVEEEQRVAAGWRQQSGLLSESISKVLRLSLQRRESIIIEGVHITMELVAELMQKQQDDLQKWRQSKGADGDAAKAPNIVIPFLVYISNEQKHRERFAVRAKYMTLDPGNNRYIKYFRNIRTIQCRLCEDASEVRVPQVDNTNVDRSLSAIHATVFSCLRKTLTFGESLFDGNTRTAANVYRAFAASTNEKTTRWSSKHMLMMIRRKASLSQELRVGTSGRGAGDGELVETCCHAGSSGRIEAVGHLSGDNSSGGVGLESGLFMDNLSDTISTRSSSSSSLSTLKREQDLIDVFSEFSEWGVVDNDDFDLQEHLYETSADEVDGSALLDAGPDDGKLYCDESGSVCSNDHDGAE